MKIGGDSDHPGETKGCWKPRRRLTGPMHKLTERSQALSALGSGRGTVAQEAWKHTGRRGVVWLRSEGWKDHCHYPWVEPSSHTTESHPLSVLSHTLTWPIRIYVSLLNPTSSTLRTPGDPDPFNSHRALGSPGDSKPGPSWSL